jgi:gluconokinase
MVVVIAGVSGSGKTTAGRALAERLGWAFVDGDELHSPENIQKMRAGVGLTDEDRAPWLRALNRRIREFVQEKQNAVIACSALKSSYRERLSEGLSGGALPRFVYLVGSYEQITRRIINRSGHFMPERLLASQFAALELPPGKEAIRIDIANPVAMLVENIIHRLGLENAK